MISHYERNTWVKIKRGGLLYKESFYVWFLVIVAVFRLRLNFQLKINSQTISRKSRAECETNDRIFFFADYFSLTRLPRAFLAPP